MIRFLVDSHNKPIAAILEIPSKDHPYDPAQDSVVLRVKHLFSAESVSTRARAAVGLGPVTWDNKVATYAKNYTNQRISDCSLVHSNGPYRENIAWGSGDLSVTEAIKLWVDEKPLYNYNSNSCAAGKMCGHYTQVVWRKSVRIGCEEVRCNNGGTFITCNYDPPGNYIGEHPY
ncbi:hypothetical protein JCGZ_09871 [Jatropha curcas]|uniref:SCP domain-containing protein n=1 Tax=Jatropha curcas TaxID=180498 RepID=A0A067KVL1_JATCU|nr:hypothetical protein JCGZ_09871 [Jatropha curcas]